MSDLTLILLAAGNSTRFGLDVKKQWLRIGHKPLWQEVATRLQNTKLFSKIIIASSSDEIEFMKNYADYTFVNGGRTRQESLKNALIEVESEFVLVSDVARACVSEELLKALIEKKERMTALYLFLK